MLVDGCTFVMAHFLLSVTPTLSLTPSVADHAVRKLAMWLSVAAEQVQSQAALRVQVHALAAVIVCLPVVCCSGKNCVPV